jgi:hypothetical protein
MQKPKEPKVSLAKETFEEEKETTVLREVSKRTAASVAREGILSSVQAGKNEKEFTQPAKKKQNRSQSPVLNEVYSADLVSCAPIGLKQCDLPAESDLLHSKLVRLPEFAW